MIKPKHEIRISKQTQMKMTEIQNSKLFTFRTFENLNLEIVSDFDIRISDLSG